MQLSHALVLTATPGGTVISNALIEKARRALAPLSSHDDRWLETGSAWQALFVADAAADMTAVKARIAAALGEAAVDINIVADDIAYRRKRLLAADMDSTLIAQELIDELAGLVGRRQEVERVTAATMQGDIDFEASLRQRVRLFAGVEAVHLEALARQAPLVPGAHKLVSTMQSWAAATVLITGGFTIAARIVAERLAIDNYVANTLEIEHGRLTGHLVGPVIGPAGKRDALLRIAAAQGLDPRHTLAVGDGANDIDMIRAAGLGVAFRAKPKVRALAASLPTAAVISNGDLSSLLALQGVSPAQ